MGTIRDARLRKDIVYFCKRCVVSNERLIDALRLKLSVAKRHDWLDDGEEDVMNMFKGIFGDK